MRNFTLLAALLVLTTATAAIPVRRAVHPTGGMAAKHIFHSAPVKAPLIEDEPVYDEPEGELTCYSRDCFAFSAEFFESKMENNYGSVVRVVTTSDGDIWINHAVSEYFTESWIRTELKDGKLTLPLPQAFTSFWGDDDDIVTLYLVPMEQKDVTLPSGTTYSTFVPAENMEFSFDIAADGTLKASDPDLLLGVCSWGADPTTEDGTENYVWTGFGDIDITISPIKDQPLQPEEGLVFEKWVWTDQYEQGFANVCIKDDNTIIISGMNRSLPGAYIQGRIEGDKAIFPSGQYLGIDSNIMYTTFFCGADFTYDTDPETEEEITLSTMKDEAVLAFDPEKKTLETIDGGYIINSTATIHYPLYSYDKVKVEYQNRNPEAAPAAPYDLELQDYFEKALWVQIPNYDVDGNLLDTTQMYYEIYLDGELFTFTTDSYLIDEDTTEIPYVLDNFSDFWVAGQDHTIYLYADFEKSIGIRSIYVDEKGNRHYSETSTLTIGETGVENIAGKNVESVLYHDLTGRRIDEPAKGMVIRTVRYTDGTTATSKILVR